VPSPGVALLVWLAGGLLSWTGAASFAELGATLPLNGGMQEYLRHVYGDTMAFLMAWIYIMAVKPSSMAIQSIVIAESIASVLGPSTPQAGWLLKLIAVTAMAAMVLVNSINTKTTMRLSESFALVKLMTVLLVVLGGVVALIAHFVNPATSLSGSKDWYTRDWFHARPTLSEGRRVDWTEVGTWEMLGHYSAAIYAGLWAYDGWDNANFVASEIRDPGRSLPRAIQAAMAVVVSCYELVNIAYYILLPWDTLCTNDAVAVAAAKSLLGRPGGVIMTILVAISCAGSITSNVFAVGRLTIAASERRYLPSLLAVRGFANAEGTGHGSVNHCEDEMGASFPSTPSEAAKRSLAEVEWDAPFLANLIAFVITTFYILTGSFEALLIFVGMAEWVFYVSTVVGLLILRRREPDLHRPYQPPLILPMVFSIIGTLVIIRSAMFAPVQSGLLGALLVLGAVVGRLRG
jgi:amino acid transporter